jgi:SM-20-related protein
MIDLKQITSQRMQVNPFDWAFINNLYSREDASALASTFPHNYFKRVTGNDGEKVYVYEARSLVPMGASEVTHPEDLSPAWLMLARDLCSSAYREAMTQLTCIDLRRAPLEVNIFHYTPGASLGPHLDLSTKIVTHAIYFNPSWSVNDGGCLTILRSSNPRDVAYKIAPVVGNSAVIVRSNKSWHAVSPVVPGCTWSRRSLTATFYHPDSPSTMWPKDDQDPLHYVDIPDM